MKNKNLWDIIVTNNFIMEKNGNKMIKMIKLHSRKDK
jgi:hypothetical protein